MGFSPGDFFSRQEELHWELKDGPRIVLWNHDESIQLLSVEKEDIRKMYEQLELLVSMAGQE